MKLLKAALLSLALAQASMVSLGGISIASATCQFDTGADVSVSDMLNQPDCQPKNVIASNGGYGIWVDENGTGARDRIISIANQIIVVGSLLSIGAIVYAGFLYATSMGDDERIKTGKNSLKFGIIGFVVMLISFPLVNAIVNLFYDIGS